MPALLSNYFPIGAVLARLLCLVPRWTEGYQRVVAMAPGNGVDRADMENSTTAALVKQFKLKKLLNQGLACPLLVSLEPR